ncbi:MAG: DUF1318 domain-containing protein [Terrimicrobiaceae bacterium]
MEKNLRQSLTLLGACLTLGGCKAPTVNLATSEPIKVDINMRLDVYQYSSTSAKKPAQGQAPTTTQTPEARRRNRMADIQQFKNERLVGEGHEGLLVIRSKPEGEYGDYVRVAVEEENADRMDLMKSLAESQKTSLPEIQGKQAELWRNRSFKGEWIETPGADGTWNWVQKEG